MSNSKQFYWDPETIFYFAEMQDGNGWSHTATRILEFVQEDCTLEDGETVNDLFRSLMQTVEDYANNQ
jgi:hypothetical protein